MALSDLDKLYLAMAEVEKAPHFNVLCYSLGITSLSDLKDFNSVNSAMLDPKEVDIIKEKVGRRSFRFDQLAQKYKPNNLRKSCKMKNIPVISKETVSVARTITRGPYSGVLCEAHWTKPDGKKDKVCLRYNEDEPKLFLHNADMANQLRHKHILDFYGVIIASSYAPSIAVVEEFAEYGSLEECYQNFSLERLCRFTIQAATALEYLRMKKAIHPHLLFNFLVVADYKMKVAGVGFCAFESEVTNYSLRFNLLKEMVPTFAKIFSEAFIGYQSLAPGHADIAKNVKETSLAAKSRSGYMCPSHFRDVFDKCLQVKTEGRPSFSEIRQLLEAQQHLPKAKVTNSFRALSPGFLSCNAGELITVISRDLHREDKGAWFGETQGKQVGFFRCEYVEELPDHRIINESSLPPEIRARGPAAERAFQKAMKNGKVEVYRGRIMLLGQGRAGKTSLKKSLLGMPFNLQEESTVGVEVDASKCEVEVDQVKNWEHTENKKLEVSEFAESIARIVAKDLNELDRGETGSDISNKDSLVEQSQTNSNNSNIRFEASPAVTDQKANFAEMDACNSVVGTKEMEPQIQVNIDITEVLPENITNLVARYLQNLKLEDTIKAKEVVLSLWDFAGQHLYYASHPVFLSERAVYLLVYNLSKNLVAEAEPCVRQGIHDIVLDNPNNETNLEHLLSWLVSIHSIRVTLGETNRDVKNLEAKSYLRPPVFVVGTNADQPFEAAKEMAKRIQKSISGKTYEKHVIRPFFTVDNTKSQNDEGVQKLRNEIMEVLKKEPYMGQEVPLRWFNFERVVEALVAQKKYHLNLDQLLTIIREVCRIDDEDEMTAMLNFYHDLGVIVKHGHTVVLQAQWLINLFKKLITVRPFDEAVPLYSDCWKELEENGILRMALIDHVFADFIEKGLSKQDILDMMELYGLIAKFPCFSSGEEDEHRYFVPAQLRSSPAGLCELKPSLCDPCPLYVHFLDGHVPHGLFSQFLSRCIIWCSEHGLKQTPQLFKNGARFFIGTQAVFDLILICRKRFIKVILKRRNPNSLGPPSSSSSRSMAVEVRTFIESTLEGLSRDFSWLRNIRHELSVVCAYCARRSERCSKHSLVCCGRDDCLHLLRVRPGEELICPENLSSEAVKVHGWEKWFQVQKSQSEEQRSKPLVPEVLDQTLSLPKTGSPSLDDLLLVAHELGLSWKMLGRALRLSDAVLEQIEEDECKLIDKCYSVLRKWKEAFGSTATYRSLAKALQHPIVGRPGLAAKYCDVHTCVHTCSGSA